MQKLGEDDSPAVSEKNSVSGNGGRPTRCNKKTVNKNDKQQLPSKRRGTDSV